MLLILVSLALCAQEPQAAAHRSSPVAAPAIEQGPFRGASDGDTVHLWARATTAGRYVLQALDADGAPTTEASAEAAPAEGFALHWRLTGMRDRRFAACRIVCGDVEVLRCSPFALAPAQGDAALRASIAFGSCAQEKLREGRQVWASIVARQPSALVLLGDTPYIDSHKLEGQRRRYREFFDVDAIAACLQAVPTYSIWDDHDYTGDGKFGAVTGRDEARRAFVEHHAHDSYGDGAAGVYHRFRRGPIEVFLLDARWFADTEPCPFAPEQRTLLGSAQIAWLQRGLAASTAPFKVLASGMVWNGAVRPGKDDCWGHWLHERDGLLRWLGEQRVAGVVLVGGDLHVTRLIRHPTAALCGYDVPECITSPLGQKVIEANARPIEGLLFDAAVTSTFLVLEADIDAEGARLTMRFCGGDGRELHSHEFSAAELTAPAPK